MRCSHLTAVLAACWLWRVSAQEPPAMLQVTRETISANGEPWYSRIERQLAELCARRCPNHYLALESGAQPTEVWWLVAYESPSDVARIADAYARDAALLDAMRELNAQKRSVTSAPASELMQWRRESSAAEPWRVGTDPFVVIVDRAASGAVFESDSGATLTVATARTRESALARAASFGAAARVFRVRTDWSSPDEAWVAGNAALWKRR
jgi:hypothetical protein